MLLLTSGIIYKGKKSGLIIGYHFGYELGFYHGSLQFWTILLMKSGNESKRKVNALKNMRFSFEKSFSPKR